MKLGEYIKDQRGGLMAAAVTFLVILLALACRRLCQGDLYNCCTFETAGDGIVESIHVFGKESLADGSQSLYLLVFICYHFSFTNRHC